VNYNIPLDPAAFATLQNTMTEGALKSYMERAAAETQKQLQQTTTAATQEAQSASQDYLNAAQQPVPEPDALAQFVPSLLGNIASVISQNPSYREQAQKDIHEKRQDLRQKRADNLLALKDMWDTKARLASSAGDREAEINARLKVEQLSKIAEQMLETQREHHGMELERLRQKGDRARDASAERIAGIRSGGGLAVGDENDVDLLADKVEAGQMKLTELPFRARIPVVRRISERGGTIFPPKVRDTINNLSAARGVLAEIKDLSAKVNKATTGMGRIKQGLESTGRAIAQSTEEDALFDKTRDGFLATISRATGERGVLTDRDAFRAKELLPTRYDKKLVAESKIRQLAEFLDNVEQRTIRNYTTALPADKVHVKRKSDGRTGYIDANDPDLKSGLFVRIP